MRKAQVLISELVKKMPRPDSLAALPGTPKLKKRSKRRLVKWGLVAGNFLLLIGVAAFIVVNRSASQTIRASTVASAVSISNVQTSPLDQLSSAQIALTAAQMTRLPETTAVRNQADSDIILLKLTPSDSTALAKPQIVATAGKSKQDIIHYTVVAGDSIASISEKYGITADTVRWSNNIYGNNVAAGTNLSIPPVNGVVYTVKAGDSAASIAGRYQTDERLIITYNDAELGGLKPGEQIVVPNGVVVVSNVASSLTYSSYTSSFTASYGGSNGYDYGYCTYYVASKVALPTNWGNANTWDNYAVLSGWTVSTVPKPGAIAQSDSMSYLGHVGLVEAVSPDGTMIKYSDMNGLAGWGRVGTSDWVPISRFQRYIYR
ncbi:LysM peptidoglycan-binding domain-containing protein [Candidatus Saccharibacteria bacterium]|nr:LysM peptidoglycan-binding domain-containing protein [Candidatus Saccharibacteria bacterium]